MNELAQLVDDLGRRSFDARLGHRGFPETFDEALWRNLENTGLARLTSSQDAGPAEAAIVLSGLARHAAAPVGSRLRRGCVRVGPVGWRAARPLPGPGG
jgi:acyl-CoA dehydrogenase